MLAKRFTDTSKWAKASFTDLSVKMKLAWIYLCDNCDHAGIWDVNLRLMIFHLGETITLAEIEQCLGDKIRILSPTKLFIPRFIEFQYGRLSPEVRPHRAVIQVLEKHGIDYQSLTLSKEYPKGMHTLKDKDKEKDKDKDKEKERGSAEGERISAAQRQESRFKFDFEALFDIYPRCQKKTQSLGLMQENIRDEPAYRRLEAQISRYRAHVEREGTPFSKQLTFPNFWVEREDWSDERTGTTNVVAIQSGGVLSKINWNEVFKKPDGSAS